MKSLLFLCHRLPYPPDKGDKIRSYHVLEALRKRFHVHLGTFIDTEQDWKHVEFLRARTASLCVRPLSRRKATLRSLRGLATGEPLTLPFYRDAALDRWVRSLLARQSVAGALVYSSGMAQYLTDSNLPLRVMDFCDLDSDKWAQYAMSRPWPRRWIYGREARLLAQVERRIAQKFDWSLFVSEAESKLFRSRNLDLAARVVTVGNGVDTDYFDPGQAPAPQEELAPSVVFTGAMDYWANIDAVQWFVRDIWPDIRRRCPEARFSIVGSDPAPEVLELVKQPGVTVTGRVPDVRPWLARANVVVAPLRIARGIQNKVLEAMSMARPIVATSAALQGLGQLDCPKVVRADTVVDFAAAVAQLCLSGSEAKEANGNRQFVMQRFSWPEALRPLCALLEGSR